MRTIAAYFMLAAAAFAQSSYTTPYTFTTLAGISGGGPGSADGQGRSALFEYLSGISIDNAGNLYVADSGNSTIRKITPAAVVTTLAGSPGNPGSADGTGSIARFNGPAGVAVDGAGNIYVADWVNYTIRKITAAGVVTTLAGTVGKSGSTDGTGADALFSFEELSGIAVDASGNIFVADTGNCTIRRITPAGVVTTLAGTAGTTGCADGQGTSAQFFWPRGVVVDSVGNVYVADTENHTIRKIAPSGNVTTLSGKAGNLGSADGTGSGAQFAGPCGLAIDAAGNIFVADTDNNTIRKVTPGGVVTTVAGLAGASNFVDSTHPYDPFTVYLDGTGAGARFFYPTDVAVDGAGNVYVADGPNYVIRKITPDGTVTTFAGRTAYPRNIDGRGINAGFNVPIGVAVDGLEDAYVADSDNNTIRKMAPDGMVTTVAGSPPTSGGGNILSSYTYPPFDPSSLYQDGTGANARFNHPCGIAVDSAGTFYVADTGNDVIRKIASSGVVTTLAGTPGTSGSADGQGLNAQFNGPCGIAVDAAGNIYVADTGNYTVRKITPSDVVTTLAGTPGIPGYADGAGANAKFFNPFGVAADTAGNIYVADSSNNAIRKITATGMVSTFAGQIGAGSSDGIGGGAQFFHPTGVAVDNQGNLFVADSGNEMIRMITSGGIVTTLAGSSRQQGSSDGTGIDARFDFSDSIFGTWVSGIAVDATGNLYVADSYNNEIRVGIDAAAAPSITGPPASSTATAGGTLSLNVAALGAATYHWSFNGAPIAGATGPTLTLSNIGTPQRGDYSVAVTNGNGTTTSAAAHVGVTTNAWLANLSSRAYVAPTLGSSDVLIAGYSVKGTAPKQILIRGIGPGLGAFGVSGFLANPQSTIFSGQTSLATATSWDPGLSDAFASVGAFALDAGSHDTALLKSFGAGQYTAVVSSTDGGDGVALAELYDADEGAPASRLSNISSRAYVGTGANILIGGFVIAGTTSETVLIRAVGPSLGAFGLSGLLGSPTLTVYDNARPANVIASNSGWGTAPSAGSSPVPAGVLQATAAEMQSAGAFALPANSADSALIATLPPGPYTVQVAGTGAGLALLEIYEKP